MKFYSSGKLLISGEYAVLFGTKALAVPTVFGQTMWVEETERRGLIRWKSFDNDGRIWFQAAFDMTKRKVANTSDEEISNRLLKLLIFILENSKTVRLNRQGFDVRTELNFDQNWGLGSSSTLVSNLSQWTEVDAIKLLHSAFLGSGYDVAVGLENKALFYQIKNNEPVWHTINWQPPFANELFFVYLGEKQSTENAIKSVDMQRFTDEQVSFFSDLSDKIFQSKTVEEFTEYVTEHETKLAKILQLKTIKENLFADYPKAIKSLGAWGGDFVLCIGNQENRNYFIQNGYSTILSWEEMVW
ncbi:MAG: GHMP kinase [Flavobacteriales bacterium]|nr:GHMP kinase [Flavobacteriales bacterium]